jgi:creatinine amidohydrolase
MRMVIGGLILAATLGLSTQRPGRDVAPPRGTYLADLTWVEAEQALGPETVVVIPVGAASKEHGPHLKLRNDAALAEYLTKRVATEAPVVIAPSLPYHFYPAFLEYPGSVSLGLETAREYTNEIVRSIARHGPRRFYVLNTGISTNRPLAASADALKSDGIVLHYTDLQNRLDPIAQKISEQEGGSHADEIETSMMLFIDPLLVDMSRAVKDYYPRSNPFTLTRRPSATGTYSRSGVWGDPTIATREKGQLLVETLVAGILDDISRLRATAAPAPTAPSAAAPPRAGAPVGSTASPEPGRCSAGDERTIRAIGTAYYASWINLDAKGLAYLWAEMGDIAHPDGMVERMREVIMTNRFDLFRRKEYRGSKHFLQLGPIRCLTNEIAVADGNWELRDMTDLNGTVQPTLKGLATLVVKRYGGTWLIEAYRYTVDRLEGPKGTTLLKRPGWPGRGGGPA